RREVLRLFSELIRFKLAHAEQNRLQEQSRSKAQPSLEAQILGVQSTVEAHGAELAKLRQDISSLLDRHVILLRELERAAAVPAMPIERIQLDIAAGLASELEAVQADIARVQADAQNHTSVQRELHAGLTRVSHQLAEMLQSRIWRTLTRAGAVLLRLQGRG